MIAVVSTGLLDILPAAFLAAFAVVALKVLTPTEARDSVDLDVIVVIAASFGLGQAIEVSGLAGDIVDAVIAIHRADERVGGKLGEVRLRTGDVLVVLAGPAFRPRALDRRDFLVVSAMDGEPPPIAGKAPWVALVVLGMIAVVSTGLLDILPAAFLAAFAVVALKVLTPTEARDSVDLDVIVVIAASFGLGQAIEASGLAGDIVDAVIEPLGRFGDLGLLFGVLVATIVVTEMISNNAAAVLLFPIAITTATQAGLDPRPFAFAVALGASSSFLTPIGYQTNTMVYGIGGYRFGDFARLGFPLAILMIICALIFIPLGWPLR
jgi:di/tricarboxylate transporter